jgi:hypothetical protein
MMGKIANRLGEQLSRLGWTVSMSDAADASADVNHFVLFLEQPSVCPGIATVGITHVDDREKLGAARLAVERAGLGICMSTATVRQLVNEGIDRSKLCYVLPALDSGIAPRKIIVGITTKVHADGRKRERLLARLAREMDLSNFRFEIFGYGWSAVSNQLRSAGAEVFLDEDCGDFEAGYDAIRQRIPFFDYYLYLGLDEGSLGTIDALAAGVKTIVTPQGFHLDLAQGITHPVTSYNELRAVFESIVDDRDRRVRAVEPLTWLRYAQQHDQIWRLLLGGRWQDIPDILGQQALEPLGGSAQAMNKHLAVERWRMFARSARRLYERRMKAWLSKAPGR